MKLKKGDMVVVRTGKDRGKRGKIIRVMPQEDRILVEGIALQIRHRRRRRAREQGQRVSVPGAIPAGNVMVVCSSCGKPTRIGFQVAESGKIRICKKCKATIVS